MSWYCGKPTNQYLNCEHWKYYGKNPPEIFTELELQLMQQHKHMRFRMSITVNVHGKTDRLFEKTIPCIDRPKKGHGMTLFLLDTCITIDGIPCHAPTRCQKQEQRI